MDDIAVMLAEALGRRMKEAKAAKAAQPAKTPAPARYAGTAAPKAAAPRPAAAPPAKPAPPPQAAKPRPAPVAAPANPAPSVDDVFAIAAAADAPSASALLNAFRSPGSFLTAFVLHEALGKPVALRDDGPHF